MADTIATLRDAADDPWLATLELHALAQEIAILQDCGGEVGKVGTVMVAGMENTVRMLLVPVFDRGRCGK